MLVSPKPTLSLNILSSYRGAKVEVAPQLPPPDILCSVGGGAVGRSGGYQSCHEERWSPTRHLLMTFLFQLNPLKSNTQAPAPDGPEVFAHRSKGQRFNQLQSSWGLHWSMCTHVESMGEEQEEHMTRAKASHQDGYQLGLNLDSAVKSAFNELMWTAKKTRNICAAA